MTIAITLISCSTGYVTGGYKANKANHEDNTFAELEVAFIRENIAVDTLNHLKANNKDQAIKIQESVMCTLVQIIRSHPNLRGQSPFPLLLKKPMTLQILRPLIRYPVLITFR